jgi:hypothetical protein
VIDPIGLALENFDVVGMWRIRDGGTPVDASGSSTTARAGGRRACAPRAAKEDGAADVHART